MSLTRESRHGAGTTVDLSARVGPRSLLAEKVTRFGNSVRVVGALTGWLTIATVQTDRLGQLDRTITARRTSSADFALRLRDVGRELVQPAREHVLFGALLTGP